MIFFREAFLVYGHLGVDFLLIGWLVSGGIKGGVLGDDGGPCGVGVYALDDMEVLVWLAEGFRLLVSVGGERHGRLPG